MKAQVNPVLCIQMHCTSIPELVRVLSKLLSDFGIYVYICIYIYIYIRLFSAHTAKQKIVSVVDVLCCQRECLALRRRTTVSRRGKTHRPGDCEEESR